MASADLKECKDELAATNRANAEPTRGRQDSTGAVCSRADAGTTKDSGEAGVQSSTTRVGRARRRREMSSSTPFVTYFVRLLIAEVWWSHQP